MVQGGGGVAAGALVMGLDDWWSGDAGWGIGCPGILDAKQVVSFEK